MAATTTTHKTCSRCNGLGYIEHYGHVRGGVCFGCDGTGNPAARKRYTEYGELVGQVEVVVEVEAPHVADARRFWLEAIAATGAVTPRQISEARLPAAAAMEAAGLDTRGLGDRALARELGSW